MTIRVRRYRLLLIVAVVLVGVVCGGNAWYRHTYPYGRSHCCDSLLLIELQTFADSHGGNFPAGEASPEASLSLIHHNHEIGLAALLCGKTGSESVAQRILDRGELLGPDTCGWHYVEGLRTDDDGRLALFWDKEGLAHHGERLSGGGHIVWFVHGWSEHIRAAEWDRFLAEQEVLFVQRKNATAVENQPPSS